MKDYCKGLTVFQAYDTHHTILARDGFNCNHYIPQPDRTATGFFSELTIAWLAFAAIW